MESSEIIGVGGLSISLNKEGDLEGFFPCMVSNQIPYNIISQDDIEKLYPISWIPGNRYVVHMDGGFDLVFKKSGKLYIADMKEWITRK